MLSLLDEFLLEAQMLRGSDVERLKCRRAQLSGHHKFRMS